MNLLLLFEGDFVTEDRVILSDQRARHLHSVKKSTGKSCPGRVSQYVTLAVGPEGGFITYEVEKLLQAGFSVCQLGERILRVENAIPVLLGRLNWC